MKWKIIGIFLCSLLITSMVTVGSSIKQIDSNQTSFNILNDDCGCGTRFPTKIDPVNHINNQYEYSTSEIMEIPHYFNWKDFCGQDWTTPAKHQLKPKPCGSCWIFAAVGTLESIINIREGSASIDPDLSEQYVLSCLPDAAYISGEGCNGGYPYDAFRYIKDTSSAGNFCNGIVLESCFPYQADDNVSCYENCPDWKNFLIPITDLGYWIPRGNSKDRKAIKSQIMETGPVVSCMLWNNRIWNWGEAHHEPNEYYPFDIGGAEHDVIVVGWKDDPSIQNGGYWICKNSLGPEWGYDGFFNIVYGSLKIDRIYITWVDYHPDNYDWNNEPPPSPPSIIGPTNGETGVDYEYTFNSSDPNKLEVRYYINWDDGQLEEWIGPYTSNTSVQVNHTWSKQGIYNIMAIAINANNSISSWGTLKVTMPRSQIMYRGWLERFPRLQKILDVLRLNRR